MKRALLTGTILLSFVLASACGKKDEKNSEVAEPPTTESVKPAKVAEVIPTPKPEAPALEKKKLEEATAFDYMDILKAKGWTDASSGGMTMGPWKTSTIKAQQGDQKVELTIVMPSGKELDPKSTITATPPKDLLEKYQTAGAAELVREDALIAVTIEGDVEGAKNLLTHVREWIIVE